MTNIKKTTASLYRGQQPLDAITKKHQEITQTYVGKTDPGNSDELMNLILFNGYYSLDMEGVDGAFISIDSNMHMNETLTSPSFSTDIILCLDGQNPVTVPFQPLPPGSTAQASFKNGNLVISTPAIITGSIKADLKFTRPTENTEVVANVSGTASIPSQGGEITYSNITGCTYNNPIFYETYIGSYHTEFLKTWEWAKVAEMKPGYEIHYNYLNNKKGELTKVPSYTYNLNMYFFSFDNSAGSDISEANKIIMGTSPTAGLVTNNMIVTTTTDPTTKKKTKKLTQRSLQTIKSHETVGNKTISSTVAADLAQFSGYYPLSSPYDGGFICIEGSYTTSEKTGGSPVWTAEVGVSTDGESVVVYNSEKNISFIDNVLSIKTLSIPITEIISVTLTKQYAINNGAGSLVNLSGTVKGNPATVTSTNNLNPIPLKGFSGPLMTGLADATYKVELSIDKDGTITYNGTKITDLTYVPVMYIAAFKNPEKKDHIIVLSLGTDGQKGMACIVTDVHKEVIPIFDSEKTTAVWALPNEPTPQSDGKAA